LVSPFSQKNIQECRCGTEACRGVLGPKPKKPVEEKSVTSALITGTKRKLQDLLGSKRAGSESSHNSPKRRKFFTGNSTTTKARNAIVETESARERVEREASDLSRQIAGREDRALKRSISGDLTKHSRSASKVTRNVSRLGALKAVQKSSGASSSLRRTDPTLNNGRGLRPIHRPRTPIRETSTRVSDSEEDISPNITPASLRSASRKSVQVSPDSNAGRGRVVRMPSTNKSKLQ
jgi:palmitoyltransferase ZDHHC9/14/18